MIRLTAEEIIMLQGKLLMATGGLAKQKHFMRTFSA